MKVQARCRPSSLVYTAQHGLKPGIMSSIEGMGIGGANATIGNPDEAWQELSDVRSRH